MECKSVKISEYSLNKIRKIGEEVGKPSDDTAVRYILDDREKLKIENELLKKKLEEYEKEVE